MNNEILAPQKLCESIDQATLTDVAQTSVPLHSREASVSLEEERGPVILMLRIGGEAKK